MMYTDYKISPIRVGMESVDGETDVHQLCSSGSEVEPRDDSPPTASPFTFSTSFEEDILDLKWWQSQSVDQSEPLTLHILLPFTLYHSYLPCYVQFCVFLSLPTHLCAQMNPQSLQCGDVKIYFWWMYACVCVYDPVLTL